MAFLSSLVKWGHTRRYNEGILHFNRGEFERAAECFEGVLQEVRDPNDPDHCLARVHAAEARANLGLAYQHAGDYARAEQEFDRALAEALARQQAGDLHGAVAALERAVAERPGYADLRCRLAGLLAESGRPDDARQHLRVALELNPRYLEARLLAARVELESGDAAA